ncbi:hypothetical protein UA32_12135 [Photobacterium angustum]|uniref:DUF7352 domain-containing protein n=1 Tax=Photobacterium angustum TaxID=661 RepID=A0ABX5GYJ1_PHOAN|nr:hypothetical protein [Photobacterium angustum]KJG37705.1 hypothetical protein UA32_12135 [Photobacterium angustum]PSX03964.1 hypothetical protein C0W27_20945 [Photobacterium angustum]
MATHPIEILKIEIKNTYNTVTVPSDHVFLSLKSMENTIQILFIGRRNSEPVRRSFFLVKSGITFNELVDRYLGSINFHGEILHVYEIKELE